MDWWQVVTGALRLRDNDWWAFDTAYYETCQKVGVGNVVEDPCFVSDKGEFWSYLPPMKLQDEPPIYAFVYHCDLLFRLYERRVNAVA